MIAPGEWSNGRTDRLRWALIDSARFASILAGCGGGRVRVPTLSRGAVVDHGDTHTARIDRSHPPHVVLLGVVTARFD
jgi:hypothetical protein